MTAHELPPGTTPPLPPSERDFPPPPPPPDSGPLGFDAEAPPLDSHSELQFAESPAEVLPSAPKQRLSGALKKTQNAWAWIRSVGMRWGGKASSVVREKTSGGFKRVRAQLESTLTEMRAGGSFKEQTQRFAKTRAQRLVLFFKSLPRRIQSIRIPQSRREWLVQLEVWQTQIRERLTQSGGQRGLSRNGKLLTMVLVAFFLADLLVVALEAWIPEPAPVRVQIAGTSAAIPPSLNQYEVIWRRNLFSSRGLLPGEGESGAPNMDAAPVRTTLALGLVGTIIMQDSRLSIATLENKGGSREVYPVRVEDEVPGMLRVLEIEARKVIFLNLQSRRKEFVDLPEEPGMSNLGSAPVVVASGIQQKSPTHFVLSRAEIDAQMANVSTLLTQARAIPHFENGVPAGLRLIQIVPGSLYDKAGIKNDDVLTRVDGEAVANDPTKGMELLTKLKSSKGLEITVRRGGRDVTLSYDIQQ